MSKNCCADCGTSENVTKHSLVGKHHAPFAFLCRDCHSKREGIEERDKIKNAKRRIKRAERRVKRDLMIIEASQKVLAKEVEQ